MREMVLTAGGIPVRLLSDTFDPVARKTNTVIGVPRNAFPWNWTARAYILEENQFTGPLWPCPNEDSDLLESLPVKAGSETETFRDFVAAHQDAMVFLEPALPAGHYYPRIWRGGYLHSEQNICTYPTIEETPHFASFVSGIRRYEGLCQRLIELFRVVHPSSDNIAAYGDELRSILLLACTEVENQWRSVLNANSYSKKRMATKDYVKLLDVLRLYRYRISLARYPNYAAVKPFGDWDINSPTASLSWYDAYNSVKHDSENNLNRARLDVAIDAVGAILVMLVAQFGPFDVREYLQDRTFTIDDFPRWTPDAWYYRPRPRCLWKECSYSF